MNLGLLPAASASGAHLDGWAVLTRHTVLPTSSATNSAFELSMATPTGRPREWPSRSTKPERIGCRASHRRPVMAASGRQIKGSRCRCQLFAFHALAGGELSRRDNSVR